ncbi:MAG: Hsp70 family protein [Candidatus Methanomethylophilaceae archaeon]|nr:Hsp70 family protein [Candidatus Methanomethylophilaceae archaeon]
MTEYCIGIDLGTTYSCLAYIDEDGDPVVEKNFEQEDTTPSVILFNENGEIIVGSPAKDMAMMYPAERIITAIKRQMGTDYEVDVDGEKYNPIMLSAVILRKMINDFNENHGCDVKKAVITCPAYFGQNERDATKTAGTIAGLDEVTVINEPTAAAISFGFGNAAEGKKRVLVYDLGGGTFDVTVLEIDGSAFTAVATDGERFLGGKDWDAVISKIIKEKVSEESGVDMDTLDSDEEIQQTLINDSETIKKRLSTAESTKGTLTVEGQKIVFTVTREEFEAASAGLIQTTIDIMDRVLASKSFSMADIDDVVLVGGSSRMPQVRNAITSKYPDANVKVFDPDQSVAKGAAIFSRSNSMVPDGVAPIDPATGEVSAEAAAAGVLSVHNVLSKTFGIKAVYEDGTEMISNIIFRNEVLPIESVKTYYPVDDGQSTIKVEIYEDSAVNDDSGKKTAIIDGAPVGEFMMELPLDVTTSTPITVKFTATDEGILIASVDCMDQHTDYQIENDMKMSADAIAKSQGLMEKVSNAN